MRYLRLLLLALLPSCMPLIDIPPGYERIAHTVSRKTAKTLSTRHGMKQMGLGGGMMHQVNMMFIAFNITRLLTIKEARAIIVDCAQEYLAEINSNEKLRPFLVTYPFPIKNIEIEIYAYTPENGFVFYPYVGSVGLYEGRISYFKNDPHDTYKLKSEIYETYEEAVDILNSPYFWREEERIPDDLEFEVPKRASLSSGINPKWVSDFLERGGNLKLGVYESMLTPNPHHAVTFANGILNTLADVNCHSQGAINTRIALMCYPKHLRIRRIHVLD